MKQRNYGIDALRILAMLMIVIYHILGQGGMIAGASGLKANLLWLLDIATFCAVNCYALISGYVGVSAKYKYTNFGMIWLRVIFYTVLITLGFKIFLPESVGLKEWGGAFLPVLTKQYWYVTAYAGLFLVMPLLNLIIQKTTKKQLRAILLGIVALCSVFPIIVRKELFNTNLGYSAWWLMILYLVGGFIAKYQILHKVKSWKLLLTYVISTVIVFMMKFWLDKYGMKEAETYIMSFISPLVLLNGVMLLVLFSRIEPRMRSIRKAIIFLSPLAFSVYLIHVHPLIWNYLILDGFRFLADLSAAIIIPGVLVIAVLVYLLLSVIDKIRETIFEKLKLKQRLMKLEKHFIGEIWNEES